MNKRIDKFNNLCKIYNKVAEQVYLPITMEVDQETNDTYIEITLKIEKNKYNPFWCFGYNKFGFYGEYFPEPDIVEGNEYEGEDSISAISEWIIDNISHFCCEV